MTTLSRICAAVGRWWNGPSIPKTYARTDAPIEVRCAVLGSGKLEGITVGPDSAGFIHGFPDYGAHTTGDEEDPVELSAKAEDAFAVLTAPETLVPSLLGISSTNAVHAHVAGPVEVSEFAKAADAPAAEVAPLPTVKPAKRVPLPKRPPKRKRARGRK